jgi:hypothetical protein
MRGAQGRRTGWGLGNQEAVGDKFESDFAFEPGVERPVDVTHAAGAYLVYHFVGPKDSARTDHSRPKAFGFTSQYLLLVDS